MVQYLPFGLYRIYIPWCRARLFQSRPSQNRKPLLQSFMPNGNHHNTRLKTGIVNLVCIECKFHRVVSCQTIPVQTFLEQETITLSFMPNDNHHMTRLKTGIVNLVCIEYTFHGVVLDSSSLDLPRKGAFTLSFMPNGNHQMTRLKTGLVQAIWFVQNINSMVSCKTSAVQTFLEQESLL